MADPVKLVPTSVTEAKMLAIVERATERGVEKALGKILKRLDEIEELLKPKVGRPKKDDA